MSSNLFGSPLLDDDVILEAIVASMRNSDTWSTNMGEDIFVLTNKKFSLGMAFRTYGQR